MPTSHDLLTMAIKMLAAESKSESDRCVAETKEAVSIEKADVRAFRRSSDISGLLPKRPLMPTGLFRA